MYRTLQIVMGSLLGSRALQDKFIVNLCLSLIDAEHTQTKTNLIWVSSLREVPRKHYGVVYL